MHLITDLSPQSDGQSERTIRTLEDLLWVCVIDWSGKWKEYLHLAKFYTTIAIMRALERCLMKRCMGGLVGDRYVGLKWGSGVSLAEILWRKQLKNPSVEV